MAGISLTIALFESSNIKQKNAAPHGTGFQRCYIIRISLYLWIQTKHAQHGRNTIRFRVHIANVADEPLTISLSGGHNAIS